MHFSPVLGRYHQCGQHPGTVPAGATVSLQCDSLRDASYVTVQFPATDRMNFRELDVCANGKRDIARI